MDIHSLQVGSICTNCYLLCDETTKKCAVIDPGGDGARIAEILEKMGYTPTCVLLTHGHYDHTNGTQDLLEKCPGIPVYLNERDICTSNDRRQLQLFPPVGETTNYDEGDTVQVGNLTVTVLATPGHSPGSVTLLCGDAMFAGDTLFAGSCGRTDLAGGDTRTMLHSLARLGRLEGDYQVLPGHMEASVLSRELSYNPYLLQALRG